MVLLLCACGVTVPTRYYTLFDAADFRAPRARAASFVVDVQPVGIPAQVDQPQLVVREGDAGMRVLEHERWVAPLADEVRGALTLMLGEQLAMQDAVATKAPAAGQALLAVKVDVQRFDSVPGEYAEVAATWSLRYANRPPSVCTVHERQTVGQGYDELVRGHRRALARIATQIAAAARRLAAGAAVVCTYDG